MGNLDNVGTSKSQPKETIKGDGKTVIKYLKAIMQKNYTLFWTQPYLAPTSQWNEANLAKTQKEVKVRRSQSRSYKEVKKTGGTWYHTDVSKQQVVVRASRGVLTGQEEGPDGQQDKVLNR